MESKIIQITAGNGPLECCWVVAQLLKRLLEEAGGVALQYDILDRVPASESGTLHAAVVRLKGEEVDTFLQKWKGTLLWVGQSQFRKFHKRKNWYVAVNELNLNSAQQQLKDSDIKYEFTRAGGPGGQHVNKVSTAVRAKHVPSGFTVLVSDSRSQLQNKKQAKQRLADLLQIRLLNRMQDEARNAWEQHQEVERGNPVRVFHGEQFQCKKEKPKSRQGRKSEKQNWLRELSQ